MTYEEMIGTWNAWNTNSTANSVYYADTTWREWNERILSAVEARVPQQRQHDPATTEQIRARQELFAEERRQAEERCVAKAAAAKVAREKANTLLMSFLTPEQRKQWAEADAFDVVVPSGNIYRINRSTHGNIDRFDANRKILERLCVQPAGVPTEDANLAQLLHLLTDEEGLRRIAGITRY